jgi:hypothetical protein
MKSEIWKMFGICVEGLKSPAPGQAGMPVLLKAVQLQPNWLGSGAFQSINYLSDAAV